MSKPAPPRPSRTEAFRAFGYIGVNSFGGPAGQIAVMHRVLVEEKKWLTERQFLHALNYCMLLPGPEAMQLATYAGWLLHGTQGGVVAGLLFVLPGALVMLGLSALYAGLHDVSWVAAAFFGIKAAVVAVVIEALLRVAKRALKSRAHYGIAAAAFLALAVFQAPFPAVIGAAALLGLLLQAGNAANDDGTAAFSAHTVISSPLRHIFFTLMVWGTVWWAPVGLAHLANEPLLVTLGQFFSKAAVVTFGGAYSVLMFIGQQMVEHYRWLTPGQMMDGLGLAETTPGPLILVNQFAGFMAGYQYSHAAMPWLGGVLGAAMATWTTFAPCFLWIFLGAPFIEQLRGNARLSAALGGITAAVVGVIGNLSLWFALHTFFAGAPGLATAEWTALAIAAAAGVAMLRFHVGMLKVLAACAATGMALHAAGWQ